ncbi:hypothetical protein CDAR_234241 [Caerostris darwini]|uniref:Uncharacterized protein n=1 Tax=Caerostris darwini TaxID=1538125 RepID=A0AAV4QLL1_9ARAC|nr:hypothetical protein CDAR_234241 [Caerostris darwini]
MESSAGKKKRSADYPCFSGDDLADGRDSGAASGCLRALSVPRVHLSLSELSVACPQGKRNLQQGRKRGQQITLVSVETIGDDSEDGRDSGAASGCLKGL